MGRVFSIKSNSTMAHFLNNRGYCKIRLQNPYKEYAVHRLVAIHFIPNPDNKPEINHIKGIKTDNRASQLEWCTPKENTQHAWKTGLIKPKVKIKKITVKAKPTSKAVAIYNLNNEYLMSFKSLSDCAKHLQRHISSVSEAIKLNIPCNNHFVRLDQNFIHQTKDILVYPHIALNRETRV